MSTVHITEAEVLQNPAALLAHMRAGAAIVIENEEETLGKIYPAGPGEPTGDPEYDTWFLKEIDAALADPRPGIDSEIVEAEFAKKRLASARRLAGIAG